MMEEVSSEDTNGESTFEFVGDATQLLPNSPVIDAVSTLAPSPMLEEKLSCQMESVMLPPSAPPLPPSILVPAPVSPLSATNTQTIASIPGDPICYAPRPSYDASTASIVSSATIDLSYIPEVARQPQTFAPSPIDSASSGIWGWFKQSEILNKFAEKAKNSVDTMITTLDPGMKDYIYSGGNVNVLVANNEEWVVSSVREAFQQTFGRATIESWPEPPSSGAPQPVGFSAGVKVAEEKCQLMRANATNEEEQLLMAMQSILIETTPDKWFETTCLVLQLPRQSTFLQSYTQPTSVPCDCVTRMQDATPIDYPLRWSGMALTIDQAAGSDQWSEALTGMSKKERLFLAAKALAGMYKASHL